MLEAIERFDFAQGRLPIAHAVSVNRPYLQEGGRFCFCFCCSGGRVARSPILPAAGTTASTGENFA